MAAVCGLVLESYLQLHKALTKDSDKVQAVTPIEECYYKVQDLKQVLAIHGLCASKFNRTELLQALKGSTLVNPFNDVQQHPDPTDQHHQPTAPAVEGSSVPGNSSFAVPSSADLEALGWVDEGNDVLLQHVPLGVDLLEDFADLPAVDTDVASLGTASHLQRPSQDQHHQPSTSKYNILQHHEQHQQPQEAVPWHPAPTAAGAYTAGGWHKETTSNVISSMPHVEAQTHVIAEDSAEPKHAVAPPAAASVAGCQHRTTAAAAAAAIIKSIKGQTVAAASAQQIPATTASIQQQSGSVQHRDPTRVQQLEEKQQQPQKQQVQTHQAAADVEFADKIEAADDDLQPNSAAGAATLIAAGKADPLGRCTLPPSIHVTLTQLVQEAKNVTPAPHTSWLLQQLQLFVAAGAVASQESLSARADVTAASLASSSLCGSSMLLGRHVGFVLTEEMPVAGAKGKQLTMPAGVYQGRVLQYLGTSCQPELCEGSCPGAHQHYRAGVVPPQLPDTAHIESLGAHDAAAGIAQAQAAATGRPVRLILDLHPRLRCQNFTDMLGLNTTMLQDAWILLKEEQQPSSSIQLQDDRGSPVVSSVAARRHNGRGGRTGSVVAHGSRTKRTKY